MSANLGLPRHGTLRRRPRRFTRTACRRCRRCTRARGRVSLSCWPGVRQQRRFCESQGRDRVLAAEAQESELRAEARASSEQRVRDEAAAVRWGHQAQLEFERQAHAARAREVELQTTIERLQHRLETESRVAATLRQEEVTHVPSVSPRVRVCFSCGATCEEANSVRCRECGRRGHVTCAETLLRLCGSELVGDRENFLCPHCVEVSSSAVRREESKPAGQRLNGGERICWG